MVGRGVPRAAPGPLALSLCPSSVPRYQPGSNRSGQKLGICRELRQGLRPAAGLVSISLVVTKRAAGTRARVLELSLTHGTAPSPASSTQHSQAVLVGRVGQADAAGCSDQESPWRRHSPLYVPKCTHILAHTHAALSALKPWDTDPPRASHCPWKPQAKWEGPNSLWEMPAPSPSIALHLLSLFHALARVLHGCAGGTTRREGPAGHRQPWQSGCSSWTLALAGPWGVAAGPALNFGLAHSEGFPSCAELRALPWDLQGCSGCLSKLGASTPRPPR